MIYTTQTKHRQPHTPPSAPIGPIGPIRPIGPIGPITPAIPQSTHPLIQQSLPPPPTHDSLLSILAQFGLCPSAFDALRSDTYEKHLAARSLDDLERLYTNLLNPALGYAQMQPLCPTWQGGRHHGRPPSLQTLCDIKRRILAEHTVNDLGQMEKLLTSLRHRSSALSKELQTEMFNAIVAMLGEELLTAKLDGQPIMENLRVVDRLLKVSALRLREQQGEARLKLQERREDHQARRQPSNNPSTQKSNNPVIQQSPNPTPPSPRMTESEKTDAMIERIYGLRPDGSYAPHHPRYRPPEPSPTETTPQSN